MTPEETTRLIDALESIAFDLKSIAFHVNPNSQGSAVSHLIDSVQAINVDTSGLETSLDDYVTPAIRAIAAQVEEAQAIR